MKLKDLKAWISSLSEVELEGELNYMSENYSVSGPVNVPEKATEDYYYTGEDDPAPLFKKQELLDDGYDEDEIKAFTIEIPKGSYYINLDWKR